MMNGKDRYGWVAQMLHWLTALAIVGMFPFAWWMTDLPLGLQKLEMYGLHKSVGVLVLIVTTGRLVWRAINPKPEFLGTAEWQRKASDATHYAMYGCLLALPIIGILQSNAANFPISVFGLFVVPSLIEPDRALVEPLSDAHEVVGIVLLVLLGLHVAAALKHHMFDRDDTLRRMMPFLSGTKVSPPESGNPKFEHPKTD
jgi:cytochrome b561